MERDRQGLAVDAADAGHPYGHSKFEVLAAGVVGLSLLVIPSVARVTRAQTMVWADRDFVLAHPRLVEVMCTESIDRTLELDLRRELDLERSHLLHRLVLLGVPWGSDEAVRGRKRGTFHEHWRLRWEPEMAVAVIEASVWGNTVETAADGRVRSVADGSSISSVCCSPASAATS